MKKSEAVLNKLRFKDLRLIQEIYNSGSLRTAAEHSGLTHPGASKILKDIEHALGGKLFQRSSKGMRPTEACERFIVFINQVTQFATNYLDEFSQTNDGIAGKVTIGITPGATSTLLPDAVSAIQERHPNIQLELIDSPAISFFPALKAGKIDFIVSRISNALNNDELDELILYREPFVIACRADHPLTEMTNPTLNDAAKYSWIYPPSGSSASYELLQSFRKEGIHFPKVHLTSISPYANKIILLNSECCTIFPQSYALQEARYGSLTTLPIDLDVEPTPIAVLQYKHRIHSAAAETVLAIFQEIAAQYREQSTNA